MPGIEKLTKQRAAYDAIFRWRRTGFSLSCCKRTGCGEPDIEEKYAPIQRLLGCPKQDDVTSGDQKSVSDRL